VLRETHVRHAGRMVCLIAATFLLAGCAYRYVDASGTEHLWGIGHLTARVTRPTGELRATVTGASTVGLAIGAMPDEGYVALGYAHQERVQLADDALVCIARPQLGALGIHVGSRWTEAQSMEDACF
jgi:hypothetical protein